MIGQKIIIGSRGSRLALIQAESVGKRIKQLVPGVEIEIVKFVTQGDRNPHISLDHMERVGVFVKELEEALFEKKIHLAVHSLKDVPTEIPEGLMLAGVIERDDPGDVLITRGKKLDDLPAGSRIGTGSQRRSVQILRLRPDVEACGIRGNVDTRMNKVMSGEYDGVILAAAAMSRLGWQDKVTECLPLNSFLPAVGQGALVIESRSDDAGTRKIVSLLNHVPTAQSITAERAFLGALGGGCRAPIAALGTVNGDILKLEGMVAGVRSNNIARAIEEGDTADAGEIGRRLAEKLMTMGASSLIEEANS